jgi:[ribosomal protein S18]-alanine N-acetyltransferase
MLTLKPNSPLDLLALGAMLSNKDDLSLVWPDAKFPFDPQQWRAALTARDGSKSYFVAREGRTIGHGALLGTEEEGVLAVSYLYVVPDQRGRGLGYQLMALLEAEAKQTGRASALRLRVRTYNPRAAHLYAACGFVPSERDGTLIIMRKNLSL